MLVVCKWMLLAWCCGINSDVWFSW